MPVQGLAWLSSLHRQGLNGMLADEMGLGKTIQVCHHRAAQVSCAGAHRGSACTGVSRTPMSGRTGATVPDWSSTCTLPIRDGACELGTCCRPSPRRPQVIALLAHLREASPPAAKPFLIIVPASLVGNWQAELASWAPALQVFMYRGPAAQREAAWQHQVRLSLLLLHSQVPLHQHRELGSICGRYGQHELHA